MPARALLTPVVFAQARSHLGVGLLVGIALAGWALWAWPHIDNTARVFAGLFGIVGCGMAAASGAGLLRPPRLILEPAGLTLEGPFRRRQWAWRDVEAFRVDDDGDGGKSLGFDLRGDTGRTRRQALPNGWARPLDEVCAALNEARARWS